MEIWFFFGDYVLMVKLLVVLVNMFLCNDNVIFVHNQVSFIGRV